MVFRSLVLLAGIVATSVTAHAASVVVPYAGSFNESSVAAEGGLPAGDYDTIGGLNDVAQFNLVAGSNIFSGSVKTPNDPSDAFLISVSAGQTLTGARISFGENLSMFLPLFAAPGPQWSLEEFDATPTIFQIPVGANWQEDAQISVAAAFSRGEGIYAVLFGNGTFARYDNAPVTYTMTFDVAGPGGETPIPGAVLLFGSVLAGGVGLMRRRANNLRSQT